MSKTVKTDTAEHSPQTVDFGAGKAARQEAARAANAAMIAAFREELKAKVDALDPETPTGLTAVAEIRNYMAALDKRLAALG